MPSHEIDTDDLQKTVAIKLYHQGLLVSTNTKNNKSTGPVFFKICMRTLAT
jgi:hypothetical protein